MTAEATKGKPEESYILTHAVTATNTKKVLIC